MPADATPLPSLARQAGITSVSRGVGCAIAPPHAARLVRLFVKHKALKGRQLRHLMPYVHIPHVITALRLAHSYLHKAHLGAESGVVNKWVVEREGGIPLTKHLR